MSEFDYGSFFGDVLKTDTKWEEKLKFPFLTRALMLAFIQEAIAAALKLRPKGTKLVVEDASYTDELTIQLNERYVTVARIPSEKYILVKYTGIPTNLMPDGKWQHHIEPAGDPKALTAQARGLMLDLLKALAVSL